MKFEIIVTATK